MNTVPEGKSFYDYKKFAILYVDDAESSLALFKMNYGETFRILTATHAEEGLRLLREHRGDIGLLITDEQMPGGRRGTWLLEQACRECPQVVRMLVTAYSDIEAAISAVNTGGIYRYITKPWDHHELEMTLKRGLEFFMVRRERDELLRQQLSVLRNAMIADRILGLGLLSRGLSQHILNGLVAVRTFLELVPERTAGEGARDQDFWSNYYNLAQRQVDRIVGLLRELSSASNVDGIQFQDAVRLYPLLQEVIAAHGEGLTSKRIEIENRIPADLPALRVDAPRFRKLFDFLIRDQISMLPDGCHMSLTARIESSPSGGGDQVVVELTDNGPGLPTDQLRMVFDPFMVRNDSPSEYGINLMACFFIVHHHGGKIEAETLKEGGTRFTLRLPLNPEQFQKLQHSEETLQRMLLNQTGWEAFLGSE
jgi:two-component system probable response regulator PhcQ